VANNGGDASHAVLDMGGCTDHWVLDSISVGGVAPTKSQFGDYYDLGPVSSGSSTDVALTLDPTDAGNHRCEIAVYDNLGRQRAGGRMWMTAEAYS
jgi:hypothetical protein